LLRVCIAGASHRLKPRHAAVEKFQAFDYFILRRGHEFFLGIAALVPRLRLSTDR
jgi:hypothetical protein